MNRWINGYWYRCILVYWFIYIFTIYAHIYIYIHMTYQWIQWYTHNFGQCFFLWVPFFGFCGCQISGIFEWVRSSRSINTSILALQVKLGRAGVMNGFYSRFYVGKFLTNWEMFPFKQSHDKDKVCNIFFATYRALKAKQQQPVQIGHLPRETCHLSNQN